MNVDTAKLRQFIQTNFSAEELRTLMLDYFRPVWENVTGTMPKDQQVQMLLEYCIRQNKFAELLAAIQRERDFFQPDDYVQGGKAPVADPQPTAPITHDLISVSFKHNAEDELEKIQLFELKDSKKFQENVAVLFEQGQTVLLQRYLKEATNLSLKYLQKFDPADKSLPTDEIEKNLTNILDNIICVGTEAISFREWELLTEMQRVLSTIAKHAERENKLLSSSAKIWIWQEIIIRVYAIGALLTYRENWRLARDLIQQEIGNDNYYRPFYWSRHFLIMVSSARQLKHDNGWVTPAIEYLEANAWLSSEFFFDREEIIDSVCQFDFLQCLLVALNNGNNVEKSFPSFATYYKRRTESFVKKLVTQTELRDLVFSAAVDDKKSNFNYQIALMISELDQYASRVFPLSSWSDDWWQDKQVKEFLTSQAN